MTICSAPTGLLALLASLVLVLGLVLTGCDSSGGDVEQNINGTWEAIDYGVAPFLFIDLPTWETYINAGECYRHWRSHAEQISEIAYRVTTDRYEDTLVAKVQDDLLVFEDADDSFRFRRIHADVADLETCGE